jgi:hypothetical protein
VAEVLALPLQWIAARRAETHQQKKAVGFGVGR